MRVVFVLLTLLTLFCVGEFIQMNKDAGEENSTFSDIAFPDLDLGLSQRAYAYLTAFLIMGLFIAVVYCHVVSVRKSRLLEQYAQQGALPEWSPLLIDRKNIRPPPPYEQVV